MGKILKYAIFILLFRLKVINAWPHARTLPFRLKTSIRIIAFYMSKLMKELVILSVDRVCVRWVEHFICKNVYVVS